MKKSERIRHIRNEISISDNHSVNVHTLKTLIEIATRLKNMQDGVKKKDKYPVAYFGIDMLITENIFKILCQMEQSDQDNEFLREVQDWKVELPTIKICSDEVKEKVEEILQFIENELETIES